MTPSSPVCYKPRGSPGAARCRGPGYPGGAPVQLIVFLLFWFLCIAGVVFLAYRRAQRD
ncbi:MAG: hypothetical protein ACREKK_00365 [Candidatus Methylomirabilales bacterium]